MSATTPPKGRPTPTRREAEARNKARAHHAQERDPNVRALYEVFAPPARSRAKARTTAS